MTIKLLEREDAEKIFQLEESSFNDGWSLSMLLSAFDSGRFFALGAFSEDTLVSFISFSVSFDTADIETVCTLKEFRNQGVATSLFIQAEELLKEKGVERVLLEVREQNQSAIALYKKRGFNQISIRKRYYKDGENALIFEKQLKQ